MVIEALIVIFGLMIGRRIFRQLDFNRIFDSKTSNVAWKVFILIQLFVFSFRFEMKIAFLSLEIGILLLPFVLMWAQEITRKRRFRRNLIPFLDFITLQMRTGRGVKDSIGASESLFDEIQYQISEISSVLHFESDQSCSDADPLLSLVCREFVDVSRTPYKAMERLKAFRHVLKTEQDFRHKKMQTTLQTRMQAAILGVLYIPLLFYVVIQYGFERTKAYMAISLLLFTCGSFVLIFISKRSKWKI